MNDELPQPNGPTGFLIVVTIVLAIVVGLGLLFRSLVTPPASAMLGKQFPTMEAAGWINEPGPKPEDLRGKIVVVDFWAYWCGPCQVAAAEVVKLHKKYKDRDVVFLGLTSEGEDAKSIQLSRDFVTKLKLPWPNGYGAVRIYKDLEVNAIPQLFIVDQNNRIVFHEVGFSQNSLHEMEVALDKALAALK